MLEIDDIRVIEGVNTQVRYLPILLEIIKKIGIGLKPLQIIKKMMEEWSQKEELNNKEYAESNGKLTEHDKTSRDKSTKAFNFYIDFLQSLNWIIKTESFVKLSKYGFVIYLLEKKETQNENWKKYLFNYYFFNEDADTILTILEILNKEKRPLKDREIRNLYNDTFFERIRAKAEVSNHSNKTKIQQKFVELYKLNKQVQKVSSAKQENKHLIPPRLAWLSYLDIITKTQKGYIFSDKGILFYNLIPNKSIKDVNKEWIYKNIFINYSIIDNQKKELEIEKIKQSIGKNLLNLYDQMYDDNAMRISLLPSLLYVSLAMIIEHNVVVDFTDIEKLVHNLEFDKFRFTLSKTGRINESYISIHLI